MLLAPLSWQLPNVASHVMLSIEPTCIIFEGLDTSSISTPSSTVPATYAKLLMTNMP